MIPLTCHLGANSLELEPINNNNRKRISEEKEQNKKNEIVKKQKLTLPSKNILEVSFPLENLPIVLIFKILQDVDLKGWQSIPLVNKKLSQISQKGQFLNALLEKFSWDLKQSTRMKFAKKAGKSLRELNIGYRYDSNHEIKPENINQRLLRSFFNACPNITSLDLSGSNLQSLPQSNILKQLKILSLASCKFFKLENLKNLVPNLEKLDLTQCTLTGGIIANLPLKIHFLNLTYCSGLTDWDWNVCRSEFTHKEFFKEKIFTLIAPNKNRYIGKLLNEGFQGEASLTLSIGSRFEGKLLNGKYHGKGVLSSPQMRYEGEFLNGSFHGQGKIEWSNKFKYEGAFSYGQRTGIGKLFYENILHFEGEFLNGKLHGKGTFYNSDGKKREGIFSNGKLIRSLI